MVDSFLANPSLLPQAKASWLPEEEEEEWEMSCHQRGKPSLTDFDVESRVIGDGRVIVYRGLISRSTGFASRTYKRHWC
jgi:hypothetical protein